MQFAQQIQKVTEALMAGGVPQSLSEMEQAVRKAMLEVGQFQISAWLTLLEGSYRAERRPCRCGGETVYQFKREGVLFTSIGVIRYKRAYYLCPHCHTGTYPLDEQLGLRAGEISAELESLAALVGAQLPFGQGHELFERMTLVSISGQSIDKATQVMGQEMRCVESEWIQSSQDAEQVEKALQGQATERLYGSLDAVKVHTEEKRNAEDNGWRDLKVCAWFHTDARPPATPDDSWEIAAREITYHCDITDADNFGHLLWATGFQRQALPAQEVVILGDGADWIWNLVATHFPKAIQIVDWFHAAEHLAQVAQAAFADATARQAHAQFPVERTSGRNRGGLQPTGPPTQRRGHGAQNRRLLSHPSSAHALCRLPPPRLADRLWHHRKRLQTTRRAADEGPRCDLVPRRCPFHCQSPRCLAQ
jgi:hypothetical protein